MGSISITELIGAYDSDELSIPRDGNGDAGAAFNRAFAAVGTGRIFVRPGTFNFLSTAVQPSGIEVIGNGPDTIFNLGVNAYVDVWTSVGTSGVRLRKVRIDANRANNALGTRYGLYLYNCSDVLIEDVETTGAVSDGMRLEQCTRPVLTRPKSWLNGRHGISLSWCQNYTITDPRSYDNCRVTTSPNADGIRLEFVTGDGSITNPHCYESAGVGGLQGYGIQELANNLCYRNVVLGGSQQSNASGGLSFEDKESVVITPTLFRYQTSTVVNPS